MSKTKLEIGKTYEINYVGENNCLVIKGIFKYVRRTGKGALLGYVFEKVSGIANIYGTTYSEFQVTKIIARDSRYCRQVKFKRVER